MNSSSTLRLPFRRFLAAALGVMVLVLTSLPTRAAFTWDGGGANANWSTANNWNPNGAPTAGTITDYIFGGTTRTTNTADGATLWEVNSITFNNTAGAFVISGTGLKLQSAGITNNDAQLQTINNTIALQATATINANTAAIALGGVVSGAFGLTKTGASTLTLSGANTYTGATTVSVGTLKAGVVSVANTSGAFGNNSAITLANTAGVILDITGFNTQIGSLTGGGATGGNVTLGAAILTVGGDNSSPGAFAGVISGTGGLTKIGTGTLTLSGTNTYTGVTTINAGTLSVGTIGNGGAAGNLGQATNAAANLVLGGGSLQYTGATASTNRNFTLTTGTTSTIDVTTGATNLTISGASTNTTGGLTKVGAGTLTLSGTNLYTGTTTVSAGTLAYGVSNALSTGGVTVNGGTLALGTFSDSVGAVSLVSGSITGSTGVLTGTSYDMQSGSVSAILGGTGALTKSTAGTVTLSGTNTYTGVTTINAGTLSVGTIGNGGAAGNLGQATNAAANLVLGGGSLQYTGATASTNRNFTLTTGTTSTIDVTTGATNLTISGASTNTTGGLTKVGAGTLTLSGTNLYTGTTTVSAGTLAYGVSNALSTGGVTVNGGTLALGTFSDSVGAVSLVSGSITGSTGVLTGTSYDMQSGSVSAILGGTGALTKSTAGTVTLSGTNTYTGVTTINAGTLSVGTIGNGGIAGNLGQATNAAANLVLGGGSLQYTGATASSDRNFTLTTGTTSTIDVTTGATNLTLSGASTNTTGGLTKVGAGTLTLSGTNLYTGTTTVSAGTLSVGTIGNGGVAGNLGQASNAAANLVLGGGTLQYTGATASSDRGFTLATGTTSTINVSTAATNLTLSGSSATTNGGLTKAGAGTLTLSGTNTYTGATTVSAGTLMGSGANSLGDTSGNITVSAGATLALDGGTNIVRSGLLTLNGSGVSSSFGALAAEGATGTTSQWTGSTTVNTASTISAADNLLIIGNGATGQFNSTTLTLNATATFNTTAAATVVPIYLPAPSYILDASNIEVNSQITGAGGITKTGTGTLSIIRGSSVDNSFTGDTVITGGKLIADGPSNHAVISSTNIYVGNLGSSANDTVVLQMGQSATASGNNIIGSYNALTDASNTNLTIYEDGLFKMNQGNNGFVNLTMSGGHVDSGGNNALLTLSGGLTTLASAQTSLIENGNLGIGSAKLTINTASGTTSSGVDLQINSTIEQGALLSGVSGAVTSLEKSGTGEAVFTGANTYGGVTSVLAGVLNIQNNTGLGQDNTGYAFNSTSNGTTVASGAQLQLAGGITVAKETLTLAGTGVSGTGALRNVSGNNNLNSYVYLSADSRINADAGTTLTIANPTGVNAGVLDGTAAGKNLTVGGAGNTTINGAIGSSVAGITKDGTGTLTLAGNDAYTGATAVTSGILEVTHSNGLSGTGVTVSSGAALQFAQDATSANIAEVGVAATINGTGVGNGGAIENLNGSNSYAGNVTLASNSRITADTGSSLTMSGSVSGAGFALDTGGAGSTTYNGVISGTGTTLTKTDSGTVTLGGTSANTYSGATSINDGTLALNKTAGVNAIASTTVTIGDGTGAAGSATLLLSQSNQIADTAAITLNADGSLNLNGKTETVGSIAGSGQILFGTGQLMAGGTNASTAYAGTLVGASTSILTKTGSGTLTINSNLNASPGDFAGTLNLSAGAIVFNASNAFTGTVNVAAGTTLTLSNASLTIANLNFTGSGTVTLDFGGASTLNVTNLTIAAGVTINIINWTNAVDYWYAANWSGAVLDLRGTTPMNQIIFDSPTWVGNNTIWQGYDHQITPVPEPSTYGALLLGAMGVLLGYRRHRQAKLAAKK